MSASISATEAELHDLVDGRIEASRRADALRRLAASPSDRARVEAWQAQNDLLRSAFAGVDREPIPAMLDLRAKPQLHCIPANDAPLVAAAAQAPSRRHGVLPALGAIVVVTIGLVGSWTLLSQSEPAPPPTIYELRGPIDADLTSRAEAALGAPAAAIRSGLPTTKIPDLDGRGFRFVGAETDEAQPASVQFRYRGKDGERLVVSVRRDAKADVTLPQRVGDAVRWRGGGRVYAMAGTVGADLLLDLATTVRRTAR